MERVTRLRIAPEDIRNEEGAAEGALDDVDDNGRTSRSGRTIRRPAQLSLQMWPLAKCLAFWTPNVIFERGGCNRIGWHVTHAFRVLVGAHRTVQQW